MSRSLALLVYGSAILALLALDMRRRRDVSFATWIPFIWLAILASRPLSAWFGQTDGLATSAMVEEGSETDRNLSIVLMIGASVVLLRRGLDWGRVLNDNKWLVGLLLYCGISVVWSDFPLVGVKRWIRALGSILMILVILSERDPVAAIRTVVRRCIYVLVPASILVIKYFRELGVAYDSWTGEMYEVGVSVNKNGLGRLCLLASVFLLSDIVATWKHRTVKRRRIYLCIDGLFLGVALWLLARSNSATSLVAFLLAAGVMLGLGLPMMRRRIKALGTILVLGICLAVVVGGTLGLVESMVHGLGRNMTLTTRTFLWADLLRMETNPLFGVGYDTFWLGDRLDHIIRRFNVNESHSGYLGAYLELGLIGLALYLGLVVSVFQKAKTSLRHNATFEFGRLQLAVLITFLVYNLTETAHRPTTLLGFAVLLIGISIPRHRTSLRRGVDTVAQRPSIGGEAELSLSHPARAPYSRPPGSMPEPPRR